jgi:hypothetical protein
MFIRSAASISLLAAVAVTAFAAGVADPKVADADKPKKETPARILREKLARPVTLDKGFDANTPLKDALDFLADRYDLTIIIDPKAFEVINVQQVEEQPVRLPRLVGVSLSMVLRLLLNQLRGEFKDTVYTGTYLIRRDYIEVTTELHARPGDWPAAERPLGPRVDAEFDKRPLSEALQELADASGINVVLDAKAGDAGKAAVTATLQNARVDTAVRLLADMAGLKSVALADALYVTTKENARELQAEQAEHKLRKDKHEKKTEDAPGAKQPDKSDGKRPGQPRK